MMGFGGFDFMFNLMPMLFMIVFVVVLSIIIVTAAKGLSQWNRNNHSPQLTVEAALIAKRLAVSHHHHGGTDGMSHSSNSTTYYATFEMESGDRLEFHVPGQEYGMLVEGDQGKLTFQGTRYLSFQRI